MHAKTVYKVCYGFMGNGPDAEDAVQETFMRLLRYDGAFESDEHLKAWLIRVASNVCKDVLKSADRARRTGEELSDVEAAGGATADAATASGSAGLARSPEEALDATLEAVLALPAKYKDVVYLHYYEGYKTDEIAQMLGEKPSTVRNRLRDARGLLRKALGGEA